MPHPTAKPATFGFLSIQENADASCLGGYLLLNAAGRPLEFHCTAPVKPTRAQEILFGPTLRPHLYGEQIALALFNKAKTKPDLVCVDSLLSLSLRPLVEIPVLFIEDESSLGGQIVRVDAPHSQAGLHLASNRWFDLGRRRVAAVSQFDTDYERAVEQFATAVDSLDLAEPFGRIREALLEAQRGSAK